MPSPIIHVTTGYFIYKLSRWRWPALADRRWGPAPALLVTAVGLSVVPDADAVLGVLAGDLGRFHNNLTHSLVVAAGVALVTAALMRWRYRDRWWPWFVVALASYGVHVLMDAATIGRGVMAYWPFTAARFQAPWMLFYGLHWSDGWLSWRHVWTAVTELALVALALIIERVLRARLAPGRPR